VDNLEGAGLKNLVKDIPDNEQYSTNEYGNGQAWTHIMVSEYFCPGAVGEYIHVNSEFPLAGIKYDPMVACIQFDERA
jgi:hypothetical protein